MKHVNVALFVPDEGCVHRCSFCNQKTISGHTQKPTAKDVEKAVDIALKSCADCKEGEIAFFGGSFTAIEREYMISLLGAAKKYIDLDLFKGIRISTRPDCIDSEILSLLKEYGVTSIEIGCQSMSDKVLMLNDRGHTAKDIVTAATAIKDFGFSLGVQMMTGLYGDSDEDAIDTAKKLCMLKPETARIYPTIVLENTRLAQLYKSGVYKPQALNEAVDLCAQLLVIFENAGVNVIRLGLHSGGSVEEGYLAGAYHPAFRELVESKIYFDILLQQLKQQNLTSGRIEITVGSKFVSQLVGQKKCNLISLNQLGFTPKIVQDDAYKKYQLYITAK